MTIEAGDVLREVGERGAKRVALRVAALAALLAVVSIAGDNAKQDATGSNIEASNLWAFYQAKTVRQTTVRSLAELLEIEAAGLPPERAEVAAKRITAWRATADRYESEPGEGGGEGRRELVQRAKAAEARRDHALAVDNMMDLSEAALQLAIVLASAAVVVGVMWLAYLGAGVGLVGVVFALLGWIAPTLIQF